MIFKNVYIGSSSEDFKESSIQGTCSRHVSKEFEVIIYQPLHYVCMYGVCVRMHTFNNRKPIFLYLFHLGIGKQLKHYIIYVVHLVMELG